MSTLLERAALAAAVKAAKRTKLAIRTKPKLTKNSIAQKSLNRYITTLLKSNTNNTTNLYNAYRLYMNSNRTKYKSRHEFEKGQIAGEKIAKSFFKYYERYANKQTYITDPSFIKGFKDGIRSYTLRWIPGLAFRSLIRASEYNKHKFIKKLKRGSIFVNSPNNN